MSVIVTLTDEQAEAVKGAIRVATQRYLNSQTLARREGRVPKGWAEIEAGSEVAS